MNTELLSRIILSRESASGWSKELLLTLTSILSSRVKGSALDWDEGAGEDWARIILGNSVIAYFLVDAPFVVLVERFANAELMEAIEKHGIVLLVVSDMDSKDYSVDLTLFKRAYPGKIWPAEALDSSHLSIMDLWWATI